MILDSRREASKKSLETIGREIAANALITREYLRSSIEVSSARRWSVKVIGRPGRDPIVH